MKKCCFIIPYFGKLPNFFSVFAKTCEKNQNYDWIIFTDDKTELKVPNNIIINKMNYEDLKKLINKKMGFSCVFSEPHKLCDYKPAYGYIFEEYIKDYKFWGHCDIDIILGNMDKFISDEMLNTYDKIFCLGHMILYKNDYENNRTFMKPLNGEILYKKVFTSPQTLIFDETFGGKENINSIFEENSKKIFYEDLSFNIKIFPTHFIRTRFNYKNYNYDNEKYLDALYVWNDGKLIRYFVKDNKLQTEEFLYMHFQQRNMKIDNKILEMNMFKIVPNSFLELEFIPKYKTDFKKIKRHIVCFHTISKQIEWKRKAIGRRVKKCLKKK